jgi:hypothetical protein
MKKRSNRIQSLIIGISLWMVYSPSYGQNFNYSLSVSNQAFQPLADPTLLPVTGSPDQTATIAIGFPFNFAGDTYNSLIVTNSGKLLFGTERKHAISGFGGIQPRVDTSEAPISVIGYKLTGNEGSRKLTLEFKNFRSTEVDSSLNFQISLLESSNRIVIHSGANSYAGLPDSTVFFHLGFINPMMDSYHKAACIFGSPGNLSLEIIFDIGDMKYLTRFPSTGTRFELWHQNN